MLVLCIDEMMQSLLNAKGMEEKSSNCSNYSVASSFAFGHMVMIGPTTFVRND